MNTRARRVRGAARGPWRAPHPAVAGVHAVCTHAARIWGGLGPFATLGHTWPRAPERPGRREHAGPAGRRRGPRPLARAAAGGGRGSRRLRPCGPDLGRIGAIWHLRPCLAPRAPGRPGRREPRLPIAYLLFLSSPFFLRVITSKTGQHGRVVNAKKSVTETIEELVIRYQRAAVIHRDSLAVTFSLARSPCFKSHVVVRP